jgi:hypothetical protein
MLFLIVMFKTPAEPPTTMLLCELPATVLFVTIVS